MLQRSSREATFRTVDVGVVTPQYRMGGINNRRDAVPVHIAGHHYIDPIKQLLQIAQPKGLNHERPALKRERNIRDIHDRH